MSIQVSSKSYTRPTWAKSKSVHSDAIGRATQSVRSFGYTKSDDYLKMMYLWREV